MYSPAGVELTGHGRPLLRLRPFDALLMLVGTFVRVSRFAIVVVTAVLHAACGDGDAAVDDAGGGGGGAGFEPLPPEQWQLVLQGLDGALMSVAGTSATDVWTVGADTRDGDGALVLHFDGASWTRIPTGVDEDLWWLHALAKDSVYVGGTGGTILHWNGNEFTVMDTPGTATVYGIWGPSNDELFAVGGDPDVAPGFVWRLEGGAWQDLTASLPAEARGPAVFKVWGRARDDVWMVGAEGLAIHWNGSDFEQADSGTTRTLFTVHGAPSGSPPFAAVGGYGTATIVEHDGTGWHDVSPVPAPPQMFGIFMDGAESGCAVGLDGAVMRRDEEAWKLLDIGLELFNPFHAVWVDSDGGVWAVGGDVLSPIPTEGMLVHSGEEIPDAVTL